MNDLPLAAPLHSNLPEYTVSELSNALKRSIEDNFAQVRVRGEVSGFKRHGSGHCYLCLKDSDAVLDAVVWRTTAIRLATIPEDGMEVVCTGRLTTYPGRSKYQLVIDTIELAGVGALLKLLEERRKRLAAEGLFAAERKRRLPFLPEVIGVVTSPSGAVIRDILHRLADRFPRRVLLWPVAVQGDGAAAQIAAAIDGFNRLAPGGAVPRPDLIIVARGGGSLEDLMPFNEEIVVRAAAASAIADFGGRARDRHDADRPRRRPPRPDPDRGGGDGGAGAARPRRRTVRQGPAACRRARPAFRRMPPASRRAGARLARAARPDRHRGAAPRRPRRAARPGDRRPALGRAPAPGGGAAAAGGACRRARPGPRPPRRSGAAPRCRQRPHARRPARRAGQFRRPPRQPCDRARERAEARLCRRPRRPAHRHRGGRDRPRGRSRPRIPRRPGQRHRRRQKAPQAGRAGGAGPAAVRRE